MGKIKVLQVIGGGEYGGAEQYLVNLIRQFKEGDIEIHLACFYNRQFADVLRKHQITVHTLLPKGRFDLSLVSQLRELISTQNYDIVHTHGVRANFFARIAVSSLNRNRQSKIPVLTTVHSVLRQDYPKNLSYSIVYWMERLTQHRTDRFIAISNSIKEDMISRGIPTERIQVIYSGIDFEEFWKSSHTSSIEMPTLPEAPIIGMVGRLQPVKGHTYAIAAMLSILEQHPNAKLVLVGDGPLLEELQQQVRELNIEHSVMFLGYQDPSKIASLLKRFTVFLMPSLSEGLGLSLIEAMSVGTPVIATEVGGMLDVVQDGTGFLVPPQDPTAIALQVNWILDNPEEARDLGERGKESVIQRFNSKTMVEQIRDVYSHIAGKS